MFYCLSSPGYGMYGGGYGGYGSYGSYGMGINRFGSPLSQSGSSSFVGRAEESSRAAFQSIESIVQAFGSVAMMLESTHFAMHNTFLAVLSMADHFSRLRTHLVSVLGAFTLFKAIRYIFRKIRALLGFTQNHGLEEQRKWKRGKNIDNRQESLADNARSHQNWYNICHKVGHVMYTIILENIMS